MRFVKRRVPTSIKQFPRSQLKAVTFPAGPDGVLNNDIVIDVTTQNITKDFSSINMVGKNITVLGSNVATIACSGNDSFVNCTFNLNSDPSFTDDGSGGSAPVTKTYTAPNGLVFSKTVQSATGGDGGGNANTNRSGGTSLYGNGGGGASSLDGQNGQPTKGGNGADAPAEGLVGGIGASLSGQGGDGGSSGNSVASGGGGASRGQNGCQLFIILAGNSTWSGNIYNTNGLDGGTGGSGGSVSNLISGDAAGGAGGAAAGYGANIVVRKKLGTTGLSQIQTDLLSADVSGGTGGTRGEGGSGSQIGDGQPGNDGNNGNSGSVSVTTY